LVSFVKRICDFWVFSVNALISQSCADDRDRRALLDEIRSG